MITNGTPSHFQVCQVPRYDPENEAGVLVIWNLQGRNEIHNETYVHLETHHGLTFVQTKLRSQAYKINWHTYRTVFFRTITRLPFAFLLVNSIEEEVATLLQITICLLISYHSQFLYIVANLTTMM